MGEQEQVVMSAEDFAEAMREISRGWDEEDTHYKGDQLLCSQLRALGYGDGVEVFQNMSKWYA